jgi:SAM-dependent methyltransferase
MTQLDEAKARAAATYNAAADTYDDPANSFWARFGRRTIDRLGLRAGDRVLDVCCGSGASAIPAADAVGPEGSVLGIDLSQNLLELAREKAKSRRLQNVEFRAGDMLDPGVPDAHFDAVVDPPAVDSTLREAGVMGAEVVAEAGQHRIASPEAWWAAVLGTGYRGTLDQLDAAGRERVRAANLGYIRQSGTSAVEANVVYAIARKARGTA